MSAPVDPNLPVLAPRERKPAPPPPEVPEDTSTQALADALRSSFGIVKFIMIALVLIFLGSGIRTVGPQEKAIILRFGKPAGEGERALLGPGLHWAFPAPIDELVKIPVGQIQTVSSTIGWYQTTAAMEAAGNEPPPEESLNPLTEGYLLTADGNIIHARGNVRYRISEPGLQYMFQFVNTSNLVRNAFNHALVYAAARYKVDDVLTRDFAGFRETVRQRLETLIEDQKLQVTVEQVDLQAIPPRRLKASFDAVLETEVKKDNAMNLARKYATETVSRAQAEAAAIVNAGETERTRLVEQVKAEAKRFTDLLPAYRREPQLFTRLHLNESLQDVLAGAQDKFVLPQRANGKAPEVRLELSREPQKIKPVEERVVEGH